MKSMKKIYVMILIPLVVLTTLFITTAIANEAGPVSTPVDPTTAPIEKRLQMPVGTPVPCVTFTFDIAGITRLDASGEPTTGSLPTIPSATMPFCPEAGDEGESANATLPATDTIAAFALTLPDGVVESGTSPNVVWTVTRHISDILEGVTWTAPGHYVFHVSESTTVSGVPTDGEIATDPIVYEMHVIVSEIDGELVVTGVYIWNSVDPNRDLEDETGKVDYMSFMNTYVETEDLIVSKEVTGSLSSTTTDFPFTVNFTDHALVALVTLPDVTVHIRNSDGSGTETVVTLPVTNVNLRHGQELIFRNVPIGNTFVATEDPGAYDPSINLTLAGEDVIPSPEGATTGDRIIGSGENIAAFTNTNDAAPITGIIMNNLPFILVGLAAAGVVAMVIVNKRRREVYE